MIRRLSLALALVAAASAAGARDITGAMAYRERIALPDGAELKVELRGPQGIVAEATIGTEGRQVPLPFVIVAPDNGDYTLQGAIFVGGHPDWVSAPIAVAAGEGTLDLGVVPLTKHIAMGFMIRMRCGTTVIEAGYLDAAARVRVNGETLVLPQTPSGSGARFSDGATPETVFWNKGNTATLTLAGKDLPECAPMIDSPLLPLNARGNEPFWRLDLTETGYVFATNLGDTKAEGPLPQPAATDSGARFDLSDTLSALVDRTICRDTMTGMPHPLSVTVTDKGQVLPGCGGAPADLLAGAWTVTDVDGATLPEGADVNMVFDVAAGRIFGKSACNRYNGGFTLTGEGLSFGPAAGTMMACPEDLMKVEQAFLRGLTKIDRFDLTPEGQLELFSGSTVVLRARR